MTVMLRTDLAESIRERSGENVFLCYQCKKCTAGCPVAAYFDLLPHQVLRACQFGQSNLVLNSRTISICAACETCSTRCPQGIDIARIMDELEIMAKDLGIKSKAPTVPMFYRSANRSINWFGRMWELGLMAELYMREFFAGKMDFGQLFKYDVPLALKMFQNGKLKILPDVARRARNGRPVPEVIESGAAPSIPESPRSPAPAAAALTPESRAIGYYPGCSLHATGIEYQMSTEAIAEKMGLHLVEPEGWVCCGTSPAHNTDHYRAIKLPMQTLVIAQQTGQAYITMPCAACFSRFRVAMHEVEHDAELRLKIAEDTGFDHTRHVQVDSLLTTVTDRIGYQEAVRPVVKPLAGLRVACYYGCLLTRPPDVTGEEPYEYPSNMDQLMKVLGAEAVDWDYKTACCGGSLSLSTLAIALDLSHKILKNAIDVGADLIATACPLCHANLDLRQKQINEQFGGEFDIPIVYFTQLMGVAYGLNAKALGMNKHLSDAIGLLKTKGLLAA